ncbi:MAG: CRP-like cAMP-binding protein [Salibacteraceae bacterium]|jgi:CRP-like cAMP-binding protein
MEAVREYFKNIPGFNQSLWEALSSKLEKKIYPKKTTLVEIGDIENYIWFIESGDVRFVIPTFEDELTFGFAFSHEFFSAYDSFITKEPCAYQLKTISDCVIYRIHRDDLEALYERLPTAEKIGRQMIEATFIIKKKREMSFLTQSAEERYLALFTSKPAIIKTMPLKYVASYIGITPQALSRIRARIVA